MPLWMIFLIATGALVLLGLLCRCCCRSKSRGRVLAPPSHDTGPQPAYPQQQYAAPYIAAVPVMQAAPGGGAGPYYAPYPTQHATPLQAPAVSPYASAGGALPAAPYPPAALHPQPYPPPPATAPADACPPSYDQVMGKQPAYNPHAQ